MIELVLPLAHPSPQPKQQIDWFSRFCTTHGRKSILYNRQHFRPKIAPSHGDLDLHLIHDSLGQSEPTIQTDHDGFSRFCTGDSSVPILYNGTPLPLLKIAPSHGGSGPHLIHGSLSPQPKRHVDWFHCFCTAH